MPLPIVAVVGRPNVGKSTFVNRIAQADEAIVHEMRGVTRDRSYHEADWNGVDFKLIDTGGIEMGDDDASRAPSAIKRWPARTRRTSSCSSWTARPGSTPTTRPLRASCARRPSPCSLW